MERIVIVGYKPFPGKEAELENLMRDHWNVLYQEGLVTDRRAILCKSNDGTIIEVFRWKSKAAIDRRIRIKRCKKCGVNTPKSASMSQ